MIRKEKALFFEGVYFKLKLKLDTKEVEEWFIAFANNVYIHRGIAINVFDPTLTFLCDDEELNKNMFDFDAVSVEIKELKSLYKCIISELSSNQLKKLKLIEDSLTDSIWEVFMKFGYDIEDIAEQLVKRKKKVIIKNEDIELIEKINMNIKYTIQTE